MYESSLIFADLSLRPGVTLGLFSETHNWRLMVSELGRLEDYAVQIDHYPRTFSPTQFVPKGNYDATLCPCLGPSSVTKTLNIIIGVLFICLFICWDL